MNHEMTKLVSALIEAASQPDARHTLKSRILELAKLAQVVPDQHFLLRTVAKSMTNAVDAVFGPLSMILVLTEPGRRQVYFAVLARLMEDGSPNDADSGDPCRRKLLERLLLQSDENLIAETYGHCPAGFVRILRRLGNTARAPSVYASLFRLLTDVAPLQSALASLPSSSLTNELIELLVALPRTSRALTLAKRFGHLCDYNRFMDVYSLLTGEKEISEEHAARICANETPARLLESLHLALPFPPPAVTLPGIRHIRNGAELTAAARDFNNCLRGFLAEAIRGERQYYVWEKHGEPAVVFCLAADRPYGWCLSECKLARNHDVPPPLRRELESLLQFGGVRTNGTLEEMMRYFPNAQDEDDDFEQLLAQYAGELEAA